MKTWARKTLSIGVLAAGALLLAPAAAQADHGDQTSLANGGILSGNNTVVDVLVPVNVAGNGIGVAGEGYGAGAAANHVTEGGKRNRGGKGHQQVSLGNRGIASGNNTYVPVTAPINIAGNGIGVLGSGDGRGAAVNHVNGRTESGAVTEGGKQDRDGDRGGRDGRGNDDQTSLGNGGALSGNNTSVPITAPINICGNGIGILGFGDGNGACANFVDGRKAGQQVSAGNRGIGSGNNTSVPIFAPININGNAIGDGEGRGAGQNKVESGDRRNGGDRDQTSLGNRGLLSGNNTSIPVTVPINVCGNALAILGYADGAGSCSNDVDGNGGTRGNGGNQGGGHHGGGHQGGNNGGNNGHQDGDDNDGDHGNNGGGNYGDDDRDDVLGDGGNQGGDDNKYGDQPRKAGKSESTPVDGLTQNLTNAGGVNLGSLLNSN